MERTICCLEAFGALYMLAALTLFRKCRLRDVLRWSMSSIGKQIFSIVGSALTAQRVEEVCDAVMQADMLRHEDVHLHVGCASVGSMIRCIR